MANEPAAMGGSVSGKVEKPKQLIPVLVNRESKICINLGNDARGNFSPSSMLFLVSGLNFVEREKWEKALKNKVVKDYCKTKIPKASAPEESPERAGKFILEHFMPCDADNPLKNLTEDKGLEYIAETLNIPTLKTLESQESRPTLLRAIRAHIKEIEDAKQSKVKTNEEG